MVAYLRQAAEFVRQGVRSFHMPHLTDWVVTGTGGTTSSFDVADAVTGGAAYIAPININLEAGITEVALQHRTANLTVIMEGKGGGISAGLGWSVAPVGGTYGGGKLPFDRGKGIGLPSGGIGCLVAGTKANSVVISPNDLEGVLTIGLAEANFGPNGITAGVVIFADRPVIDKVDLLYIKAFSLVWGIQLVEGSVALAGGAIFYSCSIREPSLAFPGARYGASVQK